MIPRTIDFSDKDLYLDFNDSLTVSSLGSDSSFDDEISLEEVAEDEESPQHYMQRKGGRRHSSHEDQKVILKFDEGIASLFNKSSPDLVQGSNKRSGKRPSFKIRNSRISRKDSSRLSLRKVKSLPDPVPMCNDRWSSTSLTDLNRMKTCGSSDSIPKHPGRSSMKTDQHNAVWTSKRRSPSKKLLMDLVARDSPVRCLSRWNSASSGTIKSMASSAEWSTKPAVSKVSKRQRRSSGKVKKSSPRVTPSGSLTDIQFPDLLNQDELTPVQNESHTSLEVEDLIPLVSQLAVTSDNAGEEEEEDEEEEEEEEEEDEEDEEKYDQFQSSLGQCILCETILEEAYGDDESMPMSPRVHHGADSILKAPKRSDSRGSLELNRATTSVESPHLPMRRQSNESRGSLELNRATTTPVDSPHLPMRRQSNESRGSLTRAIDIPKPPKQPVRSESMEIPKPPRLPMRCESMESVATTDDEDDCDESFLSHLDSPVIHCPNHQYPHPHTPSYHLQEMTRTPASHTPVSPGLPRLHVHRRRLSENLEDEKHPNLGGRSPPARRQPEILRLEQAFLVRESNCPTAA